MTFARLFQPGRIGPMRLRNRISMAPMGLGSMVESDGTLSERGIDHFVRRAAGGVGLIRMGFTRTNRDFEFLRGIIFTRLILLDERWKVGG